jgi:2-phospho-L-lactate guanylyltransferase
VERGWRVTVPVKGGAGAKSRLGGSPGLALAMAADCLAALARCPPVHDVVVVSADPVAEALARETGASFRADPRGLNDAARAGGVGWAGPCAVLLADIPAVRAWDVERALTAATEVLSSGRAAMAFVPDAAGTGTVLLAAAGAAVLRPGFGADSARRHEASGAVRLDLDLPRLRTDVDTVVDLQAAVRLGCGPRTRAALRLLDTVGDRGEDGPS